MLWGRPLKNRAKLCIIFDWYNSALLRTLFVRDIFSLDRNSKKKQAPLAVTCFLINK